ncbi:hypothetical protein [Wohlfahrtiimonas sp. G9077]|uniref:hypothetical protein n=1 Tax=Wohlfahrtiimonas sp. G9077 TaxID=1980118 RepID=UPI000B97D05B|nr:hypothetical protein [Wohlfahrtiimonas sp. G9077]OYQ73352.1 hypothetical protein B9T20_06450 [Wohlfahrtiimonas sp. G9077]
MKKILTLIATLFFITACTTTNRVSDYNRHSEVASTYTPAQIRDAIITTGKARKWQIQTVTKDAIIAKQDIGKGRYAVTEVRYGRGHYDFKLLKSAGLKQKGQSVHRRYSHWIHLWNDDIQAKLN